MHHFDEAVHHDDCHCLAGCSCSCCACLPGVLDVDVDFCGLQNPFANSSLAEQLEDMGTRMASAAGSWVRRQRADTCLVAGVVRRALHSQVGMPTEEEAA